MDDILALRDLEPGLYQVAAPTEMVLAEVKVTLRETEHFWLEAENVKVGTDEQGKPIFETRAKRLHTNTSGLLLQAAAGGIFVNSRVVDLDSRRVRVVARGGRFRREGMLEIIEKSKEYDLTTETLKASLKEVRRVSGTANEKAERSAALLKLPTEENALAVIGTLPIYTQARVLERRLEIYSHREALCRTKAENMVLRFFLQQLGGVLAAEPGCKTVEVTLPWCIVGHKLTPGDVKQAAADLFGGQAKAPDGRAEAADAEDPLPPEANGGEDAEILAGEGGDAAEEDAAAEEAASAGGTEGLWEALDEQPPAGTPAPAATKTKQGRPVCSVEDCDHTISEAVERFCLSQQGRDLFGGELVCMSCQAKLSRGGQA